MIVYLFVHHHPSHPANAHLPSTRVDVQLTGSEIVGSRQQQAGNKAQSIHKASAELAD
jgi:hypothetical protein